MLDNKENKFEIDDQFADLGWTNMKEMLDQEMPLVSTAPATKRKKPYALLILLWLVGFGAGVSTILLYQQKTNSNTIENQVPDIPIADLQQSTDQSNLANTLVIKPDKEFAERHSSQNSRQTTATANLEAKQTNAASAQVLSFNNNNTFLTKNNTSDNNSTLIIKSNNRNVTLTPSQNKKKELLPATVASKNLAVSETYHLQPLTMASVDFDGFSETDENKVISELMIPALKKIKFNWGFMTGIHAEPSKGYGGYSLGLIWDAEVDRKFGISTGLMFSRFQFNDIVLNNSPDALNFNQNNEVDPGVYGEVTGVPFDVRSSNSSSSAIRLGSADYLSVPLLLTYKTSRLLRVNMGVEYAFMLNASSNKLNGTSNQDYSATYKWYDTSSYGRLLNKTNFTVLFGLSLQANERIGFDLRYNHGFTDLSRNKGQFSAQSDTRESLQFSIMYNFGKTF